MKYIKVTYFAILLSAISHFCNGQNMDSYIKEFITIDNGLPTNEIYHIIEDKNHYIWMATNNGLVKYDGNKFTVFNSENGLPGNEVFHLFEQFDGKIFGECRYGKLFYIENNEVIAYPYNKQLSELLLGYSRAFSIYLDKKENLHIGTTVGYFIIDKKGKLFYEDYVARKGMKNYGEVRFRKLQNYILTYLILGNESKSFITQTWKNGKTKRFDHSEIKETAETRYSDKIDNRRFAIIDGEFVRIVGTNKILQSILLPNRPVSVNAIDTTLWIGTANGGVYAYRILRDSLIEVDHFLDNYTVTSTLKDHENGYWFSTREGGIAHIYNFNVLKEYESETNQNISSFFYDKNNYIVGYDNGKVKIIGNINNEYKISHGSIIYINKEDTKFLIGSEGKLYEYSYENNFFTISKMADGKNENYASNSIKLNDSLTLYYNLSFFYVFNHQNNSRVLGRTPVSGERINHVLKFQNDIVFGTNKGVSFYSGKDFSLKTKYELPSPIVSLLHHKGNLYATCKNGQVYFLMNEPVKVQFGSGIKLTDIQDALLKDDLMIIASNLGVHKYKYSVSSKKWNYEGTINIKGIHKIYFYDGTVFYVTRKTIFRDLGKENKKILPIMKVENIHVNGILQDFSNNVVYTHHENNFTFRVNAISYGNKFLNFRYRLEGADQEDQYTPDFVINYPSLSPGDYRFIISASNNGIDYSDEWVYSFTILPPFWKTLWFIITMIIVFVIISGIVIYFQWKKIKKRTELNESIARLKSQALTNQLNPHLVYNILNSIQGIIAKGEEEKANTFISRFSRFMRQSIGAMKTPYISIDDELEITQNYITLELLRYSDGLEIKINNHLPNSNYKVPPLILQPFIENAIKHGIMPSLRKDGFIHINLYDHNGQLQITIEDNGKGFGDKLTYGDGLRISKERLELLHPGNSIKIERKNEITIVLINIFQ